MRPNRVRPLDALPADAPRYLTQSAMAALLGHSRATMSNWLVRYQDEVPRPEALLDGSVPLWRAEQEEDWQEWHRAHCDRWRAT